MGNSRLGETVRPCHGAAEAVVRVGKTTVSIPLVHNALLPVRGQRLRTCGLRTAGHLQPQLEFQFKAKSMERDRLPFQHLNNNNNNHHHHHHHHQHHGCSTPQPHLSSMLNYEEAHCSRIALFETCKTFLRQTQIRKASWNFIS